MGILPIFFASLSLRAQCEQALTVETFTRPREHTITENLFILKIKKHNSGYRISQMGKGTLLQLQRWDRRQPFICGYFPENLHENDSRKESTCSGCHERNNSYYFSRANQQKAGTKIYSSIQCSFIVNECDWHILADNDERINSHCLTRLDL